MYIYCFLRRNKLVKSDPSLAFYEGILLLVATGRFKRVSELIAVFLHLSLRELCHLAGLFFCCWVYLFRKTIQAI